MRPKPRPRPREGRAAPLQNRSYLSGKSKSFAKPLEAGEGRRRKEGASRQAKALRSRGSQWGKSRLGRGDSGTEAESQCGRSAMKAQRESVSTKAITDLQAGAESEFVDDEEVLKFMVIKKNKIQRIKQQSLITLAELKKDVPLGKGSRMEDLAVENVVLPARARGAGRGGKQYHNPRNSLALPKKTEKRPKRRRSSGMKCQTKDVKVQEYFLESELEEPRTLEKGEDAGDRELKSESRKVGLEVCGGELGGRERDAESGGGGPRETRVRGEEKERKEETAAEMEEIEAEEMGELEAERDEKDAKAETGAEEKLKREREAERKRKEETELKALEIQMKRIREKEIEKRKIVEEHLKKMEKEEKEKEEKKTKEQKSVKSETSFERKKEKEKEENLIEGEKRNREKIEGKSEIGEKKTESSRETEMLRKIKENLKVMRRTFDFGQKGGKDRESRGASGESCTEEKAAGGTEGAGSGRKGPEDQSHFPVEAPEKDRERKAEPRSEEPRKEIAAAVGNEAAQPKAEEEKWAIPSEAPEKAPSEEELLEEEILENLEDMSEADIIRNGQKIILKNLNNKDFIKQVLSEVKRIKRKEAPLKRPGDARGADSAQGDGAGGDNADPEKEEVLADPLGPTSSKEGSGGKANLSIITLGSDSDDFLEEDEEALANDFFEGAGSKRSAEALAESGGFAGEAFPERDRESESQSEVEEQASAEIQSSQKILISRQSLPLTVTTQESLFQWQSHNYDQPGSTRQSEEVRRSESEDESREVVKELKVSQYRSGRVPADLDRELFARLGTFRKQKRSVDGRLSGEGDAPQTQPRRAPPESNFEKLRKLKQSNLEENLAKLKKSFAQMGESVRESCGGAQFGEKGADYIDHFGHLMDTRNTDQWGAAGEEDLGEGRKLSFGHRAAEAKAKVARRSLGDSFADEGAFAGAAKESRIIQIEDADKEEGEEPGRSAAPGKGESPSESEEKRRFAGEVRSGEESAPRAKVLRTSQTSLDKEPENEIEAIKRKLKGARQDEEGARGPRAEVESRSCSVESIYKESSLVSVDEAHSLEDCRIFIVRLSEILGLAGLSRLERGFEEVLEAGLRRRALRQKREKEEQRQRETERKREAKRRRKRQRRQKKESEREGQVEAESGRALERPGGAGEGRKGRREGSREARGEEDSSKHDSKKKVVIKKRTLKATELEKINLRNKSYSG